MRRLLLAISMLALMILPMMYLGDHVYAVDVTGEACRNADPNNLPAVCKPPGSSDPLFGPQGILTTVVNILSVIAGIVAVFVILISGAKMITSAGDPNSVHESRNALLYAVVSLVIVASAQIIVRFILNKIG